MKTISQYKDDIKALMASASAIDAQATLENRDLKSDEILLKGEILDKVEELNQTVKTLERQERITASLSAVAAPATVQQNRAIVIPTDSRAKDKFGSFGEQMMAVVTASRPGGHADPRLFNAASGLNETTPSDGGFLVQQDFSNALLQDTFQTGILASRCQSIEISNSANSMKLNGVDETSRASSRFGGIVSYWGDEASEKTASKPKFRQIELNLKKLFGLCYATDELLADAAALESFLRMAFPSEFGFKIDDALINGTGAGQPLGILNAGCLVTVAKEAGQGAATIQAENIIKMYSRVFAGSMGRAVWLVNQDTLPQLFTMSLAVGTGGAPIFMPAGGLSQAPYNTILGLPVIPIEQCATLGTVGDIILADFNGYQLARKGGIQSDMSVHVRFIFDESVFRFVLRIDGQPIRATALTPYKGSNTISHFVALATR